MGADSIFLEFALSMDADSVFLGVESMESCGVDFCDSNKLSSNSKVFKSSSFVRLCTPSVMLFLYDNASSLILLRLTSLSKLSFASSIVFLMVLKNFAVSTSAFGNFSGPKKIMATTATIKISKNPIPNIVLHLFYYKVGILSNFGIKCA